MADKPWATAEVDVPPGEDALFLHDVTGDGIRDIIVWGPGRDKGSILTTQ